MKKLIAIAALGVLTVVSAPSFAFGDDLNGSVLTNRSINRDTQNTARGKRSVANLGSIYMGDAFSGSKNLRITVDTDNTRAVNTAVGQSSEANLGSVMIPQQDGDNR